MPVEFQQQEPSGGSSHATRLVMRYDGSGRRISKTAMRMVGDDDWDTTLVTHYTGIGTEVRENLAASEPVTQVVVNMPQGLGRYGIKDADHVAENGSAQTFEWYLKNHLGSTMLVYGSGGGSSGGLQAAYDYRSFGEQIELTSPSTGKVTENFTGKEKDDETQLDYFGARYLDPMLGMWISVDPARQFASPYLYAGNGMNPMNIVDPDGNAPYQIAIFVDNPDMLKAKPNEGLGDDFQDFHAVERWGHSEFGDDFAIRIVRNQNEMINFVKEGEYTAIVGHTWQGEEGMLFNRTRGPSDELNLNELDEALMGSDSFAKVFGCKTGKWNVEFSQIEYGGNKGKLPIGKAYEEAARYLTEGWNTDHRLETNKPTTSDE